MTKNQKTRKRRRRWAKRRKAQYVNYVWQSMRRAYAPDLPRSPFYFITDQGQEEFKVRIGAWLLSIIDPGLAALARAIKKIKI